MILSNITVPLVGLVDTAVIGHLPEGHYLGAVAIGAMIFSVLYWAFGFLRMGTSGMTAQAVGANQADRNRTLLGQSLVMGVVIGLAIIVLQTPLINAALMFMDAEPLVSEAARAYAEVRIYGAPAVLCNYALLGWFVGNQNTRIPFVLLLVTNLLNMVMDLIAVYGLGMTADGVALASVIAEYGSLLLGLWFARSLLRDLGGQWVAASLTKLSDYAELFRVNRYLFVRTLSLLFAIAFFTSQGAQQSTSVLSANAVLLNFVMIISNGLDGFAHAIEALTGKRLGAKDVRGFYRAIGAATLWSLATAAGFTLFFGVAGEQIIFALTSLEAVREVAMIYLPWLIFLPLVGVWSFLLDGIFIGATQVKAMQNTMLISVFVIYLPLWWVTQPLGNHGLWLAFTGLFAARAITAFWVSVKLTRQERWQEEVRA